MQEVNEYLNHLFDKYNRVEFIDNDPISIPHKFSKKEDIEIAGFLSATIAWGNRKTILKSANQMVAWMDNSPYDFIVNANDDDLAPFNDFKYRTFSGEDCLFFLKSIQNIYKNEGGIGELFQQLYIETGNVKDAISQFRAKFLNVPHLQRSEKHIANTNKGSAAKRINMYLRWMVRNDNRGVDFGIWDKIPQSALMMPLDVHSGNVARKLGLLERKQNDWKAVDELTTKLKEFDSNDPVKFDFALFGAGVNGEI